MAVYCGMLVALVDRDPGGGGIYKIVDFTKSYNEHGRGRWKSRR